MQSISFLSAAVSWEMLLPYRSIVDAIIPASLSVARVQITVRS
jgi:hypothetical protein